VDALSSLVGRLPAGTVSTHHGELLSHARDRWALALLREARGDRVSPPTAVVFPTTTHQVSAVLEWAGETGTAVVPRGAGTGLTGGAESVHRSIVLDLSRMNRIVGIDEVSQTVQAEAGARGGDVEAALADRGLTLGHEIESLAISTVGGWIASASAGYASPGFGAIEDMVIGLTVVVPRGHVIRLKPIPRTAAGPDLRRFFVGSEGAFGVITEATLAAARLPAGFVWEVLQPHSFESGSALVREIVQRRHRALAVRLLDESAAGTEFAAFGHHGALLILGFDRGAPAIDAERFELRRLARDLGASPAEDQLGDHWWMHRFDSVLWMDEVMGPGRALGEGVVADWIEVAGLWRRLPRLYDEVRGALFKYAERVECHLAHPRSSGAALRFSFVVRADDDRAVEEPYREAWTEALNRCLDVGGTLTHHHGVGVLKAGFMAEEIGDSGVRALRALKWGLDPKDVMNPGKLVPRHKPNTR
jgi:alkyldihydroxyacetonephosphate synthase